MKWIPGFPIVVVCLNVVLTGVGWTYESLPGFTGKQLTGTVKLKGTIPSPKRFNLVLFSDPYYCGRISDGKGWRISPMPSLGPDSEISGAVVFLEEVKKGKPRIDPPKVIQAKNCVFLPHVSVTQSGQPLHFQNWDPVQHKLEVFLTSQKGGQSLLGTTLQPHPENRKRDYLLSDEAGLHQSGPEVHFHYDNYGVLLFRCGLHDFMEGWTVVLPHPYFSLTDKNGQFSITDIPPGTYNLIAWHPLGQQETRIEVGDRKRGNINILITPNSPTVYEEDETSNNPFGIDLVGDSSIVPTVERQKWEPENSRNIGAGP